MATIMTNTEYQEKLKSDIQWLMLVCPEKPAVDYIEPAAQAIGIIQSFSRNPKFDQKEIMKLSMAGWIGMKARKADEKRFQETDPYSFIHLANHLVDPNDNGDNYEKLITKLSSQ